MTDETDARRRRLKAALRDNLRRRKAQGRDRAAGGTPPEPSTHPPEPKDAGVSDTT